MGPVEMLGDRGQQLRVEFKEESFQGPVPHPQIMGEYERTLPGSADRILSMAERQEVHRHQLERSVVEGNLHAQSTGQWMGFAICLGALGAGTFLIWAGKDAAGFAAMFVPLGSLVGLFVWGRQQQRQERREKLEPPKPSAGPSR